MSGSPKYCTASLTSESSATLAARAAENAAADRRAAEAIRQQREAERLALEVEARRKREEERQRRGAELEAARDVIRLKLGMVLKTLGDLYNSQDGSSLPTSRREQLEAKASKIRAAIAAAATQSSLSPITTRVADLEVDLTRLRQRRQDDEIALRLEEAQRALRTAHEEFHARDLGRQALDREGRENVLTHLVNAEALLKTRSLEEGSRATRTAIAIMAEHWEREDRLAQERAEHLHLATEAWHAVSDRVASLGADSMMLRYRLRDLGLVERRIAVLERSVLEGKAAEVLREVAEENNKLNQLEEEARLTEEADRHRAHIVTVLQRALEDCGFSVQKELTRLADSASPILLVGEAPGRSVTATIAQNGQVAYHLEGYPFVEGSVATGQVTAECDEAILELTTIHATMRQAGVEVGPIEWDGKRIAAADEAANDSSVTRSSGPLRERHSR